MFIGHMIAKERIREGYGLQGSNLDNPVWNGEQSHDHVQRFLFQNSNLLSSVPIFMFQNSNLLPSVPILKFQNYQSFKCTQFLQLKTKIFFQVLPIYIDTTGKGGGGFNL